MLTEKRHYRHVSQEALRNVSVKGRPYPLRNERLVLLGEDEAFIEEAIRERAYLQPTSSQFESLTYYHETDDGGQRTGETVTTYSDNFAPYAERIREILGSMGLLTAETGVKGEHRVGGKTVAERIGELVKYWTWCDPARLAEIPSPEFVTLIDWRKDASATEETSSESSSEEAEAEGGGGTADEATRPTRVCRFPFNASVTNRVFADLDHLQSLKLVIGSMNGVGISTLRFDAHKEDTTASGHNLNGDWSVSSFSRMDGVSWSTDSCWFLAKEDASSHTSLGEVVWSKSATVCDSRVASLFVGKKRAIRNAAGEFAIEKVTADVIVRRKGCVKTEDGTTVEHLIVRAYPVTFLPAGVTREDDLDAIDAAQTAYEEAVAAEGERSGAVLREIRETYLAEVAEAEAANEEGEKAALAQCERAKEAAHAAFLSTLAGSMAAVNDACREADRAWIEGGREGKSASEALMDAWEEGAHKAAEDAERAAGEQADADYMAAQTALWKQRNAALTAAEKKRIAAVDDEAKASEEVLEDLAEARNEAVNPVIEAEVAERARIEAAYEAERAAASAENTATRAAAWESVATQRAELDEILKEVAVRDKLAVPGLDGCTSDAFNGSDSFSMGNANAIINLSQFYNFDPGGYNRVSAKVDEIAAVLNPIYASANERVRERYAAAEETRWREANAIEPLLVNERLRLTAELPVIPFEEAFENGETTCEVVAFENVVIHYAGMDTITGCDFQAYYDEMDGGDTDGGGEDGDGAEGEDYPTDWRASAAWKARARLFERARITESCVARWYG